MPTFRDRVNEHLPIILQLLSTASLVVIALSALCSSQSLKQLAGSHEMGGIQTGQMHKGHKH